MSNNSPLVSTVECRMMVSNNLRWIMRNGEKVLQMKDTVPLETFRNNGNAGELHCPQYAWIDVPFETEQGGR